MAIAKQSHPLDSPQALLRVTKHLSAPPERKILRTINTRNFVVPDEPKIARTPSSAVEDELVDARTAWTRYQSTRRRDAVYDYLRAVSKIVHRWKKEQRTKASVHQALRACGRPVAIRNREPFGVVIFCTSDADSKTRSKWVRAVRFAERSIPDAENLAKFIKGRGGINECADRFSNRAK